MTTATCYRCQTRMPADQVMPSSRSTPDKPEYLCRDLYACDRRVLDRKDTARQPEPRRSVA